MNTIKPRLLTLALCLPLAGAPLFAGDANTPDGNTSVNSVPMFDQLVPIGQPMVDTKITLRSARSQVVAPLAPLIANVIPGTALTLTVAIDPTLIQSITWYRDTFQLTESSNVLHVAAMTAADVGIYTAVVATTSSTQALFEKLTVRIDTPQRLRLLNMSTRATLTAGQRFFITGFVISPTPGSLKETKTLLVRVVGPTLANYGVTDALADPDLHVYDAAGAEVMPSPTAAVYPELFKDVPARVGAFPLAGNSTDVRRIYQLPTGAYSAKITSLSNATGTALLEMYEVPE